MKTHQGFIGSRGEQDLSSNADLGETDTIDNAVHKGVASSSLDAGFLITIGPNRV